MEPTLIPYLAEKRMAGKPHKVEYAQRRIKAGATVTWTENAHCIIVDQPSELVLQSDLGVYNNDHGDHEHMGNLTAQNKGTSDIILSFIRLIPQ